MRRPVADEVLRSLGHVRAYVAAGDASETIVHALAHHGFGALSTRLKKVLATLQSGESFETTLRRELDRVRDKPSERAYSMLLNALVSESSDIERRLATISEEVMEANAVAAKSYAKRVQFLSSIGLFIGLWSIFVPVIHMAADNLSGTPFMEGPVQWDDGAAYTPFLFVFAGLFATMIRWR